MPVDWLSFRFLHHVDEPFELVSVFFLKIVFPSWYFLVKKLIYYALHCFSSSLFSFRSCNVLLPWVFLLLICFCTHLPCKLCHCIVYCCTLINSSYIFRSGMFLCCRFICYDPTKILSYEVLAGVHIAFAISVVSGIEVETSSQFTFLLYSGIWLFVVTPVKSKYMFWFHSIAWLCSICSFFAVFLLSFETTSKNRIFHNSGYFMFNISFPHSLGIASL